VSAGAERPRRRGRGLALAAAFGASFAATGALVGWALDRAGIGYAQTRLDTVQVLARLTAPRPDAGRTRRVLFLGDSLSMDTHPPDRSVPAQLAALLAQPSGRDAPIELQRIVASALTPLSHFFLSGRLVGLDPDQVVVEVNLWTFSPSWIRMERPEIAGLLPASRWPAAAALPLGAAGLSADRLVTYRALVAAGALDAWARLQREQVRVVRALDALGEWLQARVPLAGGIGHRKHHDSAKMVRNMTWGPRGNRVTAEVARGSLAPVLAGLREDNATLLALESLLADFERARIPALVYVAPLNVEQLRGIGVMDDDGLRRSLDRLRDACERRGARFLDLHDLLEDAAFSDYLDHLHHDPEGPDGAARIAGRIAEQLRGGAGAGGASGG
jgi:hypothetical protein